MAWAASAAVLGFLLTCEPASADWQPSDGHKMHYPQLPDEEGWDVNATQPNVLADDWQCSQTGLITDIHFWGSWRDMDGDGVGDVGTIQNFVISIHDDIPAGVGVPYSRPGNTLREWMVGAQAVSIDPPTLEAWYDPATGLVVPNDHGAYFQYNIKNLDIIVPDPFIQVEGTIYWLNISAIVADPVNTQWGWKSSRDHFQDHAVWSEPGYDWMVMYEPARFNLFNATMDPQGQSLLGSGTNYYGEGWYYYPSEWWNIWFYDNPYTTLDYKWAMVDLSARQVDPFQAGFLTLAINWSTPAWSLEGNPPWEPRRPPLPGVDEGLYIGRQILWQGPLPPA
ncbi:MAG: hypothetical protein Q7R41_08320, partial [Phycisphaerales bacterium]|nr:hypothetical protein [Phycisphaerales bacterium]